MSAAPSAKWASVLRATWRCGVVASALVSACSVPVVPFTGTRSLSVGEWSGTTSQGMPITLVVSPDETVTTITVDYNFNGCSGSHTFADLNVPTAPDVTCIPGPCSGTLESYRAFGYSVGSVDSGPFTQINGLFLPRDQARGQATFSRYPTCGTAPPVEWTATRR
jgi:hypothetical protein